MMGCFWGHKFDKWSEPMRFNIRYLEMPKETFIGTRQVRTCQRCGLIEYRRIDND